MLVPRVDLFFALSAFTAASKQPWTPNARCADVEDGSLDRFGIDSQPAALGTTVNTVRVRYSRCR